VEWLAINPSDSGWVFPKKGFLFTNGVKAQVALVLTNDKFWGQMPFVYRAMIGDAAIAASQNLDQRLLESERPLFEKAQSSGLSVVSFTGEDTAGAT
jgi:TRAP-type C4-dicarboxylate transport system substrate-binding protein